MKKVSNFKKYMTKYVIKIKGRDFVMKDNQLIKEYYEGDEVEVVNIKPCPDYGKHYYEVFCENDEGEFMNIVCVQNDMVVVVPG